MSGSFETCAGDSPEEGSALTTGQGLRASSGSVGVELVLATKPGDPPPGPRECARFTPFAFAVVFSLGFVRLTGVP
jgi:hypothetical protein